MTTFGDCPGCLIHYNILRLEKDSIVMHGIFQYLQHMRRENTRYIVTIRNPTDRVLSHYFYVFKSVSMLLPCRLAYTRTLCYVFNTQFCYSQANFGETLIYGSIDQVQGLVSMRLKHHFKQVCPVTLWLYVFQLNR